MDSSRGPQSGPYGVRRTAIAHFLWHGGGAVGIFSPEQPVSFSFPQTEAPAAYRRLGMTLFPPRRPAIVTVNEREPTELTQGHDFLP